MRKSGVSSDGVYDRTWLVKARKTAQLRQEDVAKAANVSVGFYNRIPTGALLLISDQPMADGAYCILVLIQRAIGVPWPHGRPRVYLPLRLLLSHLMVQPLNTKP